MGMSMSRSIVIRMTMRIRMRMRMPENMKVSTESGKLTAMTSEAANVRRRRQQTGFRFRVMAFTDSSWQSTTMSNCHTVSEEWFT